ncbi:MAG: 3-dehydroquinate synthase [Oscillospiraceae bacterium]|nr:3-dehydroquinate synthase [Oscillospiraceae bacterium]
MHTISIQTSHPYYAHVGSDLLPHCGELITAITDARVCALITDTHVAPLYAQSVCTSLRNAGFTVHIYTIPAGEAQKTLSSCAKILSFFAQIELTRTDFVIALGGGVIGDIAGFCAAIYQRGIDFIQIPTTLLAACDASVGGKTAVDLPEGKNLAGAFHQPRLVICDTDTFQTLPQKVFSDGTAEIIKHALIADASLFHDLLEQDIQKDMERIVYRNIAIKAAVVAADEREHGQRKLLNFGHTLGHAIEKCSGFQMPHGSAVAIGMVLVTRAAQRLGYTPPDTLDKIFPLLHRFGLPCDCPYHTNALYTAAIADKKRTGNSMDLVILNQIGNAGTVRLSLDEFRAFVEAAQ